MTRPLIYQLTRHFRSLRLASLVLLAVAILMPLTSVPAHTTLAAASVDVDYDGVIGNDSISYFTGDPASLKPAAIARLAKATTWLPLSDTTRSFGLDRRPYWFRIELANPTGELQLRYLQIEGRYVDHLDIYVVGGGQLLRHWRLGNAVAFSQRPVPTRATTVPITVTPHQHISVMVRARTDNVLQLRLALHSGATLAGTIQRQSLLFGIYYGIMTVILCYNLMAYVTIRDRSYLFNVGYVAALTLFYANLNGLAAQYLWPAVGGITELATQLSLALAALFGGLFAHQFLMIDKHERRLGRAFLIVVYAAAAVSLVAALDPSRASLLPMTALLLLECGVMVATGIKRWWAGDPGSMLYTAAWLTLFVGGLVMGSELYGLLRQSPILEQTGQACSAINVILLALAMVSRFREDRRQRFRAEYEALEYERANQKLRQLSTTDALTGMHNRRFFDERFHYAFSRSRREYEPIALLVIDIDFFKRVNDTYGHAAGDQILREIAAEIAAEARRDTDVIARLGGEEFAAVLPGTTAAQANEMAERIRIRIADRSYHVVGDGKSAHALRISVSIGVAATIPYATAHAETLLSHADNALYSAKKSGRNQVVIYTDPPLLTQPQTS